MMVKLEKIFGPFEAIFLPSSRGTQNQTVRAERSIIPYSSEIHRREQSYKYSGCHVGGKLMIIGTLIEIENCQIRGHVSQGSRY